MKKRQGLLMACLVFISTAIAAQGLNEAHALAVEQEDLSKLMDLYAEDAVLLPEFSLPRYGVRAIKDFYREAFAQVNVRNYKRTMHDSKQFENYIVETGSFSYTLLIQGDQSQPYTGNYLVVWKADKRMRLRIFAEMWGSDTSKERGQPIANPRSTEHPLVSKAKNNLDIRQAIDKRTAEIEDAVKKRDGLALTKFYTKDAIYIPYYSPMLVGEERIKQYYVKHEDPAVAIDSVKIQTVNFVVVNDIVVTTAEYGVRWRAGEHSGKVTGKNLNVWRRGSDGKYLLFRQMANHD